jgi:hypothetical protein
VGREGDFCWLKTLLFTASSHCFTVCCGGVCGAGGGSRNGRKKMALAAGQNQNHALFNNRYSAVNMCNIQIRGRTQVTTVANIGRR